MTENTRDSREDKKEGLFKCENCNKKITNFDTACYSRETSVYLCSLDCLNNYAHEYLCCVQINPRGEFE